LTYTKFLSRTTHSFSKFLAIGAGGSLFLIFAIIFINSVRRYSFGESLEWGEELPVFLSIYGVMFGAAWGYLKDKHVKFTMVISYLPKRILNQLNYLSDALVILIGVLLTYSGYQFAIKRGGIESPGLVNLSFDLSEKFGIEWLINFGQMFPYQLAISIGGFLILTAALLRLLNRLNGN